MILVQVSAMSQPRETVSCYSVQSDSFVRVLSANSEKEACLVGGERAALHVLPFMCRLVNLIIHKPNDRNFLYILILLAGNIKSHVLKVVYTINQTMYI